MNSNADNLAKSKHEQILDIIDDVTVTSSNLGIAQIVIEDDHLDGRHITVDGTKVLNFGSCSYLGLEMDERLKQGAIDAVNKYGTQFSSSRAYLSVTLYREAEALLEKLFRHPVILSPSVTLGHMSAIPVLISNNDAVILDSQVHDCVQTVVDLLRPRNIHIEVVRHSRLDLIEERIKLLSGIHEKVWYLADGVYSMYGDYAPVKELVELADKYPAFHLYFDDAHGMSWTGIQGAGYVLNQVSTHPKMFVTTSTNKSFGAAGGVLIFPNEESKRRVRNCGRTMIFSGPVQPPMLGAIIASAKVHLSDELAKMQQELQLLINHFTEGAVKRELPLMYRTNSPINFIGVGKPEVGYSMVRRLLNKGFYINLSVFPSVSYNQTGLRIPINRNLKVDDIDKLLDAIKKELPEALEDANSTFEEIHKAFRPKGVKKEAIQSPELHSGK